MANNLIHSQLLRFAQFTCIVITPVLTNVRIRQVRRKYPTEEVCGDYDDEFLSQSVLVGGARGAG